MFDLQRYFYESLLGKRLGKRLSALEHVCYRQVSLYCHFGRPAQVRGGNEPLSNLISLRCLCKQRPVTVFPINKLLPLVKMSVTQNFSGKKYGSNLERRL